MSVITISRQYGSFGNEIAARACEILGYQLFDRAYMTHIAAKIGLSEDELVDFSEAKFKPANILNQLVSLLTTPPGESPAVTQVSTWQRQTSGEKVKVVEEVGETKSAFIVGQTILAASKVGNVVIVGRAGQAILQQIPGVLHVRIEAPLDLRVQRVQDQEHLSPQDAQKLVSERDKASGRYVKHFYGLNWSDSSHYHLVINTGKWDVESAAGLIVAAVGLLKSG